MKKWTRTLENIIDLYMPTYVDVKYIAKDKELFKQYKDWHRENIIMNLARNIRHGYTNKKRKKTPVGSSSGLGVTMSCGGG